MPWEPGSPKNRIIKLIEECRVAEETAAGARSWEEEREILLIAFEDATTVIVALLEKCTL